MLKEVFVDESKEIKRKNWRLIYNPGFEQYRDKYKNIVSVIKGVLEGEVVDGFDCELLRKTSNNKSYFKLSVGGENFFIKKTPNKIDQGGVEEFRSAEKAKKILSEEGIDDVRVIDYIFAYSDSEYRYVVSRYEDFSGVNLDDFIKSLENKGEQDKAAFLREKLQKIEIVLKDFWDVHGQNMGFDKETGEVVLFDLNMVDGLGESSDDEL